jgi:signal transduction histidine kinase
MAIGQPFDPSAFYSTWVNWWLTDSGGTLYLAPAVILWLGLEREPEFGIDIRRSGFQRRDFAVWAWIAVVCLVLFLTPPLRGSYIRSAFPFLLVVPLSWIALRMSLRSAYTLVSLVAIVATAGTVAGYGPFQNHALANPLQLVGTLVVLLATNVLTIVALVSERQEAEQANRAKSLFLAHTTHELRTPLNAIIGFSSLINSQAIGPISEPRYADYAKLIHSSGEHLLALINSLLEMSKIEAGPLKLNEERVALASLIEPAVALIRIQAEAKAIALRLDLPDGEIVITVDPRAWQQILLNLLSNAVKFTPDHGSVGIVAEMAPNGALRLRVWDSGIGIPAEALERVFAPFERAHARTKPHIEGTGLGLSITRGLVMLHGGTVTIDSVVDGGTTVTMILPPQRIVTAPPRAVLAQAS